MRVLIACEESQTVCLEFRKLGHDAYSCDLVNCSGGHPEWHIKDDVLNVLEDGWDMMIAHPVCKRLTNAGARWMKIPPPGRTLVEMWKELFAAAEFYKRLRDAPIKKKAIENPIMHCHASELLGKPKRHIVQPHWFGDKAFKATGFELINLPPLVATNQLVLPAKGTQEHKEWSFIHRMPPGPDRERLRSKTFPGMAAAFAAQWGS
jgi:hypothetical protein